MKVSGALKKFIEKAKLQDSYWVEQAKLNFSIALDKQRQSAGLSCAALAEKLGTSAAYISRIFRGDANLTIESMVKMARATGGNLRIQIVDEKVDAQRWAGPLANLAAIKPANQQQWRTNAGVSFSQYDLQDHQPELAAAA